MGQVRLLPEAVAARIAAGEVIERPASAVKELVDNSLDAGARRIRVELAEGGLAEITVSDDGCGMDAEDAVRAFARHATSKLRAFEQLPGLRTLGFRGEALPSIAAVAAVELRTAQPGAEAGTRVRVPPGGAPRAEPVGAAPGTAVTVRDLFCTMPARRAALRGAPQELAACLEVLTAVAVARPDVALLAVHGGRECLCTPGDGELLSTLVALWGPDVAQGLLPVHGRDGGWEVSGLCGTPARARGNRALEFLSVDGRPVRAEAVRGAVEAAYRNLLMVHRYPVFVLHLAAAPGLYDQNVHPSKREVRFQRPEAVRDLCHAAVRAALRAAALIPDVLPAPTGPDPYPRPVALRFGLQAQAPLPAGAPQAPPRGGAAQAAEAAAAWTAPAEGPVGERDPGAAEPGLPPLRALGQVADAYIVAEGPDGLYLVDQHAAHERVFFEQLGDRPAGASQVLLQPLVVDLTAQQWALWARHRQALAGLGLQAEEFGGRALAVRAVPAGYGADPGAALGALLQELAAPGTSSVAARLAGAACRAAVKAGQRLAPAELDALLGQLARCREPHTCPHGRPTVLHLETGAIERHFGRR